MSGLPTPQVGDEVIAWYARRDPSTYVRVRVIGLYQDDRLEVERLTSAWPFGGHVGDLDHATITLAQVASTAPQPGSDLLDLLGVGA